jgi:zinc and cadmium transporter
MNLLIWIILFSLLGGILSVIVAAVYLLLADRHRIRLLPHLISLATGTLLGAAFIGLLPHALEGAGTANTPTITLCVLIGVIAFFLLEKMVIWRHCHDEYCEEHASDPRINPKLAAGTLILLGDGIHNFVDGILITAAFLTDLRLGIVTSLAVALHEIPQEVGDFAILLDSGFTRRKAFFYNLISSLTTVLGALFAWISLPSSTSALPYILAITASSFIYIAVADLIPGLHKHTEIRESVAQVVLITVGISLIYGLDSILHQ